MAKRPQIVFFIIPIFIIIALVLIFTLMKSSSDQPEVFVTGFYDGETFFKDKGNNSRIGATLPDGTGNSSFLAKYSNNGIVDWAARQDGAGSDTGRGVATDSQNNVYMTGKNGSDGISFYSAGSDDARFTLPAGTLNGAFLAKYSNSGIVDWAARQEGAAGSNGYGVATDSQNNIFMTGNNGTSGISFYSAGSDDARFTLPIGTGNGSFLAKYSNSGIVDWAARQDGGGNDLGYGVATDSQNNVFMTGYNGSAGISFYSAGNNDGASFTLPGGILHGSFLAKYSNIGLVEWAARQEGGGNDIGYDVATDSQNNVFMTGSNGSGISFYSAGNNDGASFTLPAGTGTGSFLAKYSNSGSMAWAARQDGGGGDYGRGVATDSQNNVFMTGYNGSGISFYSAGNNDGASFTLPAGTGTGSFLAKYSNSGSVAWAARQDGAGTDYGYGVATDSQNNIYMTGDFYGSALGISFYNQGQPNTIVFTLEKIGASDDSTFTSKYNSKGEFQWAAVIGPSVSSKQNAGNGIAAT